MIEINAINPDNKVEINQLVDLFKSTYSNSYPIKNVYDPVYWHNHIGSRFFSLVAKIDDQIVFHVGVCPDTDDPKRVRLVFPCCKPEIEQNINLHEMFLTKLLKIAAKQSWSQWYYFLMDCHPQMSHSLFSILGGHVVSLLPDYFETNPILERSFGHVNLIQKNLILSKPQSSDIFLTVAHAKFATTFFSKLDLARHIQTEPMSNLTIKAEGRSMQSLHYKDTNISHVMIEPSIVVSERSLIQQLSKILGRSHYVFLNILDPMAITVAEYLERAGYILTGFIPNILGRDSATYSKPTKEGSYLETNLSSSSYLTDYINTQGRFSINSNLSNQKGNSINAKNRIALD